MYFRIIPRKCKDCLYIKVKQMKKSTFLARMAVGAVMLCTAFLSVSCNAENDIVDDGIEPCRETNRTVLAYMVGDINLWAAMEMSVNALEEGWDESCDGTLLLYLDNSHHLTQFGCPVLLEVVHDTTDMIASRVVKTYEDQDAADPEVMRGVLEDAIRIYPARSHGLIIGTHGNGWIPVMSQHQDTKSLSGPERYGSALEICDLARILPVKYEFILFHACCMANVESIYQLRDKCDYVAASAMNLPGLAYPYDEVVPYLFAKPHADFYKFVKTCGEGYGQLDPEAFYGFTVSVVKTSELKPLAGAVSRLLDGFDAQGKNYDQIRQEMTDNDYLINYSDGILLDISGLGLLSHGQDSLNFKKAMDKAVVLSVYVDGGDEPENVERLEKYYSGLSFYLPKFKDTPLHRRLNEVFKRDYDWSKASGFDKDRI